MILLSCKSYYHKKHMLDITDQIKNKIFDEGYLFKVIRRATRIEGYLVKDRSGYIYRTYDIKIIKRIISDPKITRILGKGGNINIAYYGISQKSTSQKSLPPERIPYHTTPLAKVWRNLGVSEKGIDYCVKKGIYPENVSSFEIILIKRM